MIGLRGIIARFQRNPLTRNRLSCCGSVTGGCPLRCSHLNQRIREKKSLKSALRPFVEWVLVATLSRICIWIPRNACATDIRCIFWLFQAFRVQKYGMPFSATGQIQPADAFYDVGIDSFLRHARKSRSYHSDSLHVSHLQRRDLQAGRADGFWNAA